MRLLKPILAASVMFGFVVATGHADPPPAGAGDAGSAKPQAADQEKTAPADAPEDAARAKLEAQFEQTMSGATLVGFFTMEGSDEPPRDEKYTINKVTKMKGDLWLFAARIQFGGKDVTVPLPLPVKWAGDTAVITVNKVGIPGLGTYSARVLIDGDRYAGTWDGGNHGGHLWGKIEKGKPAGEPAEPAEEAEPATK